MREHVGRTRIVTTPGTVYLAVEDFEQVALILECAKGNEMVEFLTVTGQAAFPPERLFVRVGEIVCVQECSAESWVWNQRASELHYARQLQEESPADRQVNVMEDLVRVLQGEDDE